MIYSLTPSDINFHTIWTSSDFGKLFVRKNLVRWNHSYIKYALDFQHFYEAFVKNAIKCKKSGKKRESNHLD